MERGSDLLNPYESPPGELPLPQLAITDEVLRQMLTGKGTLELEIADVSDLQLYGHQETRQLTGDLAAEVQLAGFEPEAYQAVLWWCLLFIPVWPKSTCIVLARTEPADPGEWGGSEFFRILPIAHDRRQIRRHYEIAALVVLVAFTALVAALTFALRSLLARL